MNEKVRQRLNARGHLVAATLGQRTTRYCDGAAWTLCTLGHVTPRQELGADLPRPNL